jgi:hypothetical protein
LAIEEIEDEKEEEEEEEVGGALTCDTDGEWSYP